MHESMLLLQMILICSIFAVIIKFDEGNLSTAKSILYISMFLALLLLSFTA